MNRRKAGFVALALSVFAAGSLAFAGIGIAQTTEIPPEGDDLFAIFDMAAAATERFCERHPAHHRCQVTTTTVAPTTTAEPTTTTTAPTTTTAAPTTTTTTLPPTTTTTLPPTTTTTLPPTTTTTTPPSVCTGVAVAAGSNLASVANAHPANTTFCLASGTFTITSIIAPKAGQKWIGALGAQGQRLSVITGNNTIAYMLQCHNSANCVGLQFKNFILERFASQRQQSPIQGPVDQTVVNWLIDNIESRNNLHIGLASPNGTTVRNSYIHHNGQMGAHGQGDNVLWENNEIAFNNPAMVENPSDEGGAMKFVNTINHTFRGNNVHDNCGFGIWYDGSNTGVLIENNDVRNNSAVGIFWELTDGTAIIRNNQVHNNALGLERNENGTPNTVCTNASQIGGIYLSDSKNAEVYGNVLSGNEGGVTIQQSDRKEARNHYVHDNQISYTVGWTGFRCNGPNSATVICDNEPTGIRFENNAYDVPTTTGEWWSWRPNATSGDFLKTWSEWQALGFDDTGSVS